MPGLLSSNGGWSFTLRSYCPDSDDESEDDNSETQLLNAFDLSSREDAAQFKPNPWSIAKINAASRTQQQSAPISIPNPRTSNHSDKLKQTFPARSSSKQVASRAQPSKPLKESTEKSNHSPSHSQLHIASPVHQQRKISTCEVSTGGARVNVHSPAHSEPHDSKDSSHIAAFPATSDANNIHHSLRTPGRTPVYKSSRESTTPTIANIEAHTPFTVYAPNSHHTPQTGGRFTTPCQRHSSPTPLLNAFDPSSRKDAAQFKPNPWSIAKINAASRTQQQTAPISIPNPKTSKQSHQLKHTSPARAFSKQVVSHAQPSKPLKESTEKSNHSPSSSQLHITSPVHQQREISTGEDSTDGAHVKVHSPALSEPHDSKDSTHIAALPAISDANNIHHSLQTPGRSPIYKYSRDSITPSIANVEAHTPFTVYENSHHTPQTNRRFTTPYQYPSSPLSTSSTIYESAFGDNAPHSTSSGDYLRYSPDDISMYSGVSEVSEQNARQNVAYTGDSACFGLSPMTPTRPPLYGTAPPSSVTPSPARQKRRLPQTESPSRKSHRGVVPAYTSLAFSDGDVWSTLPERKNPKLNPRLHVKTSGKFRLPIALPPRSGISVGERRPRVTLYRPPPMHSPSSEANILKVRRVGRPGRGPTEKSARNGADERGKSDDDTKLIPSRGADSSVENSTSSSTPSSHVSLAFPVDRLQDTYAATRRVISDRKRAFMDAFGMFGLESCGIVKKDDESCPEIEILRWEVGPHTQDVNCSANTSDIVHGTIENVRDKCL